VLAVLQHLLPAVRRPAPALGGRVRPAAEEAPAQKSDQASDFTHFMPKPRAGNVEVWLPAW
jgi:hypothetical protein